MFYYVLIAAICATLGFLPRLLTGSSKPATVVLGGVFTAFYVFVLWIFSPALMWPNLLVLMTAMTLLPLGASFAIASIEDEETWPSIIGIVIVVIVGISPSIYSAEIFHADDYANLVQPEKRVWTQDIQPRDPKHMRMASKENAEFLATKVVGEAGAIGSQYQLEENQLTLQQIKGHLYFVGPLDFRGYRTWSSSSNKGVPAYIMVDAEDPQAQAKLVHLPAGKELRYTPGAYFGKELKRHLRMTVGQIKGLTDYSFEVDDEGNAFWVVTVYEPTIGNDGNKVIGAQIVDPNTGAATFYESGKIPVWVDRIIPSEFAEQYLDWKGELSSGWVNANWDKLSLFKGETPRLSYGADNQCYWVIDLTSTNGKDDSLVGMAYVNSRTGKTVLYDTKGGATGQAVIAAVNQHNEVAMRKMKAAEPQIYNVYGTMAAVMPLLGENHAFQGVAIANLNRIQSIAVGNDQYEALRVYQKLMTASGQQIALDKTRTLKKVSGTIDRMGAEIIKTGVQYYLHLPGIPHLFVGDSGLSRKLMVSKVGDKVEIEYYASGEDLVPMHSFDNKSLELSSSTDQQAVKNTADATRKGEETEAVANTVTEKLKHLSPEQLQQLDHQLK